MSIGTGTDTVPKSTGKPLLALPGDKLYCSETKTLVCEKPAQNRKANVEWQGVEFANIVISHDHTTLAYYLTGV